MIIQFLAISNCTICSIDGKVCQAGVAITFLDGVEKGSVVPRTTFLCDEHQNEVGQQFVRMLA